MLLLNRIFWLAVAVLVLICCVVYVVKTLHKKSEGKEEESPEWYDENVTYSKEEWDKED